MKLEVNTKLVPPHVFQKGNPILVTPDIDEDYWTFRVKVSRSQAVIAFPKFTTMGIGFMREEDWNTNLPFGVDAEEIYQHIKRNKGSGSIRKSTIIEAIKKLQAACKAYYNNEN